MPMFERYIGIDYSGAGLPHRFCRGIKVYQATRTTMPQIVAPPNKRTNWSRQDLSAWLIGIFQKPNVPPTIVGIDHGFSFLESYFAFYRITSWDQFLVHFDNICATRTNLVSACRSNINPVNGSNELRQTEIWSRTAKSVFDFCPHGVAHSTYAGLPFLLDLRNSNIPGLRFWPFDGFGNNPSMAHTVCEVYPTLIRKRYTIPATMNTHERDAYAVSLWLQERDNASQLWKYFSPPLTSSEEAQGMLEGWILGVM